MDVKSLDKYAHHVVCNWYKAIGFNPVNLGIDYSLFVRYYLWDKVGRALRLQHNIDFGERSIYQEELIDNAYHYQPLKTEGTYKKKLLSLKKTIFIPYHTPHTAKLVKIILNENKYGLLSKETTALIDKTKVVTAVDYDVDYNWAEELCHAVLKGLAKMKVDLLAEDKELLVKQVSGTVAISALALKELKVYKPNALYVHSDNHPPYINYVLAAKKLGVRTFTYQHGLDCEHFYYDDSFTDYVAVWSEKRKQSYYDRSQFSPKKIETIGNALLEDVAPENKSAKPENILLVTRPHSSKKCYAPSRNCQEGVNILKSILSFLDKNPNVKLIIKPHPADYIQGYLDVMNNANYSSRVFLSEEPLAKLLPNIAAVITEDTTAGAETMLYGKPCVHAHFAKSNPVLPFVAYKAAFPGFSPEELLKSLKRTFSLSETELKMMQDGQKSFLKDYMPLGKIENLYSFISNNM